MTTRPTPYLAVDVELLDRNIARMAAFARGHGLALRPHAKTHKSPEIARRQLAAGTHGLTVATVSEAEIFVAAGCTDVFVAYPLWADDAKGSRLRALAERATLAVGVDSAEGAEQVARTTGGAVEVLIEIDSGHHRTGTEPRRAADVARAAIRSGLSVRGVFTFPGHGYGPGVAVDAAGDEAAMLAAAADVLLASGVPVGVRSGGSTPTAAASDDAVLTEIRPGVYVFNDAQQAEMGTCELADIALTAVGTVVSRSPGRVVVDAGGKVLAADRAAWATGHGRLPDLPGARVTALSEHHATVTLPPDTPLPELGSTLRVAPNHVCAAVNLADELVAVSNGAIVDIWPVTARGANT